MLTCKQASQLISQSLDHPLSWSQKVKLRLHLLVCIPCNQFKQQLKLLRVALQRIRNATENDQNIQLPLDVKDRILKTIESDQQ
ncbi:MAG: zf-HC2 domain-containing protein [Methylotenera sp.]